MRLVPLFAALTLAACASSPDPYPDAQEVLAGVAAKHQDLVRLTLHAVPQGSTQCTQVASTVAARRGKPSDPEDLQALRTGNAVVLDEQGAIDVTVPILMQGVTPTAVAGVTLRADQGANRDAVVQRAHSIAQELATAIKATGKGLW
jgi:hypothetical protein